MTTKKQIIDTKYYILEIAPKRRQNELLTYKRVCENGNYYIELKTPFERYLFKNIDNMHFYIENYAFMYSKLNSSQNYYKYKWSRKEIEALNEWFKRIHNEANKDFDLQIEYKFR